VAAAASSQRLTHLVGVNGFFCALAQDARHHPDAELERWWSEQACATHWGRLVRPDGYGRWREHHRRVDFFLEYDQASEAPHRLAGKLVGYLQLADASGITPRCWCGCPPQPARPPSAMPWPAPASRWPPPPPTPTTAQPGRCGCPSTSAAPDSGLSTSPQAW
jgi:Replication-relaxation